VNPVNAATSVFDKLAAIFQDVAINDTPRVLVLLVTTLAILAPGVFVAEQTQAFRIAALAYLAIGSALITRTPANHSTLDLGNNFVRIGLYFVLGAAIYALTLNQNPNLSSTIYRTPTAALAVFWLIIGYWESVIRQGIEFLTGSALGAAVFMGVAHTTAYSSLSFIQSSGDLIISILVSIASFIVFTLVNKVANGDVFIESIAHGLYNFYIYGFSLLTAITGGIL